MSFVHAKKGTKLILIGQILLVCALAVTIAATALMVIGSTSLTDASESNPQIMIATFLFMGTAMVALAAQVLSFIGMIIAGKDEPLFRIALIFTILCIVCDTASGFLQSLGSVPVMIATALSSVIYAAAVCFGLKGVASLANKASNPSLAEKSKRMIVPVIAVTVLAVALTVINSFVSLPNLALIIIVGVAPTILNIVAAILYITILNKTKEL